MRLKLAALLSFLAFPVAGDVPKVVTDVAPVHSLVAQIMQGVGEPDVLLPPGASPHDFSLKPSQARTLQNADLIVWVGPDLAPWLGGVLGNVAQSADMVTLSDAAGTRVLPYRDEALFDDEEHDDYGHETHDDHGHEAHDGHDHDPHMWLDPENAKVWLVAIAEAMSEMDPENASTYKANAQTATDRIDETAVAIAKALAPVAEKRFVVFHDAYQYFEARFGLHSAGAISLGDAQSPSPSRIAQIRDAITDAQISCVFAEPQFSSSLVKTVSQGNHINVSILDPLGVDLEIGPSFYTQLLMEMTTSIVSCLQEVGGTND
ncbi:zinc ABC transporter substrate-binding protein [Celeribacter arenosi]|uniref:High-affinity zinc uptake system protein ZnuA n=1 Tax=Celeribacter arenosi TaxID=792649 RepID=A0ABP7K052_9RHOB